MADSSSSMCRISKDSKTRVLLPPIAETIEPLDESNQELFGETVISEEGKLLKKYLTYQGFSSFLTRAYDHWIHNVLPAQVRAYTVRFENGGELFFEMGAGTPSVLPPFMDSQNKVPLYPYQARLENKTYYLTLLAQAKYRHPDGRVEIVTTDTRTDGLVEIGRIPLILGSKFDHLFNLNASQMIQKLECVNDPLGYFIINGKEKIILIQELLRLNRVFVYVANVSKDLKFLTSEMIVPTLRGTKRAAIFINKRPQDELLMNFDFLKHTAEGTRETISMMSVFNMLGVKEVDDILARIYQYISPDNINKIRYHLAFSVFMYQNSADPFEVLREKREEWRVRQDYKSRILAILNEELFPNINETTIRTMYDDELPEITEDSTEDEIQEYKDEIYVRILEKKLNMLGLMAARLLEVQAGIRPPDDRDSWSNKRLESGPRKMEELFRGVWKSSMDELQKIAFETNNYRDVLRRYNSNRILDLFVKSFNANSWGEGSKKKENITEFLDRNSILSVYAHITKVKAQIGSQNKTISVRLIQSTQLGYICSITASEGDQCGIAKNLAVTAQITIEKDIFSLADALKRIRIDPRYTITQEPNPPASTIILNGFLYGYGNGRWIRDAMIEERRAGRIEPQTCIVFVPRDNILYIYNDSSRPVRPLLIVENGKRVIDTKRLYQASISELIANGALEYIDAWEQEYINLAQNAADLEAQTQTIQSYRNGIQTLDAAIQAVNDGSDIDEVQEIVRTDFGELPIENPDNLLVFLQKQRSTMQQNLLEAVQNKYTHCEIDPNAQFGVASSVIPLPNHQPAPRGVYQTGMGKQALGIYHSNYLNRFDTSAKTLATPTRPLFETQISDLLGVDKAPYGETVIVAIAPYLGFNQEDAIVFNKASVDRGLFMMNKITTYDAELETGESFQRPPLMSHEKAEDKYSKLDEMGVVRVGSYVEKGDIIIGKIKTIKEPGKTDVVVVDKSVKITLNEDWGVVKKVYKGQNGSKQFVRVLIQRVTHPTPGDKYALRYSQKGVASAFISEENMPFIESGPLAGKRPDVLFNPHSLPSRMSIGLLIELITSKTAAMKGERVNATAFQNFNIEKFKEQLVQYGFNRSGNETLYNGMTGEIIPTAIYTGLAYYTALRHHVRDKIQARGTGGMDIQYGQPFGGRGREGGQKFGEMERDALISHGATAALQERLCYSSDARNVVYCKTCGTIAKINATSKTRVFQCTKCANSDGEEELVRVTVPYSYLLLTYYLSAVGINLQLNFTPTQAVREKISDREGEEEEQEEEEEEEEDFEEEGGSGDMEE